MIGAGTCFWKFTESINTMRPYFDTSCDNRWIVWDDEPVPNLICPYCNKTIWFTENSEKITE